MISSHREMPRLHWPAILAGAALAVASSILSSAVLPPIPAAAASFFGLFISGVLAGKLASAARVYHGAIVGAGYVISEALGVVPASTYLGDPVADTVAVILSDALRIAVASVGGWCSRVWSSSDRDRGR